MNTALLRRKTMEIMARHRGPDNAIKRDELVFQLSLWDMELHVMLERDEKGADRAVRRIYTTEPIASSDAGLYMCRTAEELAAFKAYMVKNYGQERAFVRVQLILRYYPNLAMDSMKQQDLGLG